MPQFHMHISSTHTLFCEVFFKSFVYFYRFISLLFLLLEFFNVVLGTSPSHVYVFQKTFSHSISCILIFTFLNENNILILM